MLIRSIRPTAAPASSATAVADQRAGLWRHIEPVAARHGPAAISDHRRRMLVRWLRRTAEHRFDPHPAGRRRELLLRDRVASVRTDLLEIAATLERMQDPEPACVAALHELLADGCESPLYNPEIHPSELRATLHGVRVGLALQPRFPVTTRGGTTDAKDDIES